MASIHLEGEVATPAAQAWAAVRDVGQVHRRLVPDLVTDVQLDGDTRIVHFANGLVVRERIVDLDEARRRLAYTAVGGRASHHHAVLQVEVVSDERCRLVWVTDVLPAEMAAPIEALMRAGLASMKRTLEAAAAGHP